MGTPRIYPVTEKKILLNMATDPDYVVSNAEVLHELGRDIEIAEAVYSIDLKKVMKYLRYRPIEQYLPGHPELTNLDKEEFSYAAYVAEVKYYERGDNPYAYPSKRCMDLFLLKRGGFMMTEKASYSQEVGRLNVFEGVEDLCNYIDSKSSSPSPYISQVQLSANNVHYSHRYAAVALTNVMIAAMDSVIEDRYRWLEELEQASDTAKRRAAQIPPR